MTEGWLDAHRFTNAPECDTGWSLSTLCLSHTTQAENFVRLTALSTSTVVTMPAQLSKSAKHVSSKDELCCEYNTQKNSALSIGVEPRAGRRSVYVNSLYIGRARMGAMDGVVPVLEEDEYLYRKREP